MLEIAVFSAVLQYNNGIGGMIKISMKPGLIFYRGGYGKNDKRIRASISMSTKVGKKKIKQLKAIAKIYLDNKNEEKVETLEHFQTR